MNKLIAGEAEVKVGSDVVCGLETRLSLIQALIPIGLEAVSDVLQQEVGQLAGVRYEPACSRQAQSCRPVGSSLGEPEGFGVSDGPEAVRRRASGA